MASAAHFDGHNAFILIEDVNHEMVLGLIDAAALLHD
jgi:hypothetical protein